MSKRPCFVVLIALLMCAVFCLPVFAEETVKITFDLNGGTKEDWQEEFWTEYFGSYDGDLTHEQAAALTTMTVPDEDAMFFTLTPPKNCEYAGLEITHAGGTKTVTAAPAEEVTGLDFTQGGSVKILWEEVYYTLTLHVSTLDGEDALEPIKIRVGSGTEFGEALKQLDPSYDYNTSLFELEGYSDALHLRRSMSLSEMKAYEDKEKGEFHFEVSYVPAGLSILRDMDIYYVLTKPVENVELSVTAPKCGAETSTAYLEESAAYDMKNQVNRPQITVPEGAVYSVTEFTNDTPYCCWINSAEELTKPFEGKFAGENEYYIRTAVGYLKPGYNLEIGNDAFVINGAELVSAVNRGSSTLLVLKVKAEHDWGEWAVTKEATASEEGVLTRTCKGDATHTETKAIDKPVYTNVEGNGAVWTAEGENAAVFSFKRSESDEETFARFTGLQIDGADVDKANYTAAAGSVVITLKPEYLGTLAAGEHTLKVLFNDGGSASAAFTVKAAEPPAPQPEEPAPQTGDESAVLYAAMFAAAFAVMLHAARTAKRRER